MKNHSILLLIGTLITGMLGFSGIGFEGIEVIRVFCIVFLNLFLLSMVVPVLVPKEKMRSLPIRNDSRRRF